ncbi:MAG: hypothetical protein ABNH03_03270 [Alteromonas sp.]|jgi:hypothetical protein|uniref:hypothetical protein n=1 Tax=Alteromonas sp. TaxID=232 RepID=UPI0032D9A95A
MNNIDTLKEELIDSRKRNEYAEVVLTNLLRLADDDKQSFKMPFDDVVGTIEVAIELLKIR